VSFYAIVRGPLGAGKTTVARALAGSLRGPVISIDELLERYEWDGGSEELFLRTNEPAAEEARRPLANGAPVVFDGNFYWPRVVEDLAGRLPYPHVVFLLDVPLQICIARDRTRPYSYGEKATREVFARVSLVRFGVPVDGTRPLEAIVGDMVDHLAAMGLRAPEDDA
jgi:thymidylate kinase